MTIVLRYPDPWNYGGTMHIAESNRAAFSSIDSLPHLELDHRNLMIGCILQYGTSAHAVTGMRQGGHK